MLVNVSKLEAHSSFRKFPRRYHGRELCFRSNFNLSATQTPGFTLLLLIAGSREKYLNIEGGIYKTQENHGTERFNQYISCFHLFGCI
jgi:hypothetical protein